MFVGSGRVCAQSAGRHKTNCIRCLVVVFFYFREFCRFVHSGWHFNSCIWFDAINFTQDILLVCTAEHCPSIRSMLEFHLAYLLWKLKDSLQKKKKHACITLLLISFEPNYFPERRKILNVGRRNFWNGKFADQISKESSYGFEWFSWSI